MGNECAAMNGMRNGRGNRSTWRKPFLMPFYPPQILHGVTWGGKSASSPLNCGRAQEINMKVNEIRRILKKTILYVFCNRGIITHIVR
jgi:hypothetical protein